VNSKLQIPASTIVAILLCFAVQGQDKHNFQSLKDGSFDTSSQWSKDGKSGSTDKTSPGCTINDADFLVIEHELETTCSPVGVYGETKFHIKNGGHLSIDGNMDIYGAAQLLVDDQSSLFVDGDLTISGESEFLLEGNLTVTGNVNVIGEATTCGTGKANVSGSVAGDGWCLELSIQPVMILGFKAELAENQNVRLTWDAKGRTNQIDYVIERSDNGMTFTEIARFTDPTLSKLEFTDLEVGEGNHYYRLSIFNRSGSEENIEFASVSVEASDLGLCDLVVDPNPCVPSCIATLIDCPSGVYNTSIMDASGQMVSQLMPLAKSKSRIQYHINKENLLMPGVYVIRAEGTSTSKSKKVIVK
jgi:hypothetical protein